MSGSNPRTDSTAADPATTEPKPGKAEWSTSMKEWFHCLRQQQEGTFPEAERMEMDAQMKQMVLFQYELRDKITEREILVEDLKHIGMLDVLLRYFVQNLSSANVQALKEIGASSKKELHWLISATCGCLTVLIRANQSVVLNAVMTSGLVVRLLSILENSNIPDTILMDCLSVFKRLLGQPQICAEFCSLGGVSILVDLLMSKCQDATSPHSYSLSMLGCTIIDTLEQACRVKACATQLHECDGVPLLIQLLRITMQMLQHPPSPHPQPGRSQSSSPFSFTNSYSGREGTPADTASVAATAAAPKMDRVSEAPIVRSPAVLAPKAVPVNSVDIPWVLNSSNSTSTSTSTSNPDNHSSSSPIPSASSASAPASVLSSATHSVPTLALSSPSSSLSAANNSSNNSYNLINTVSNSGNPLDKVASPSWLSPFLRSPSPHLSTATIIHMQESLVTTLQIVIPNSESSDFGSADAAFVKHGGAPLIVNLLATCSHSRETVRLKNVCRAIANLCSKSQHISQEFCKHQTIPLLVNTIMNNDQNEVLRCALHATANILLFTDSIAHELLHNPGFMLRLIDFMLNKPWTVALQATRVMVGGWKEIASRAERPPLLISLLQACQRCLTLQPTQMDLEGHVAGVLARISVANKVHPLYGQMLEHLVSSLVKPNATPFLQKNLYQFFANLAMREVHSMRLVELRVLEEAFESYATSACEELSRCGAHMVANFYTLYETTQPNNGILPRYALIFLRKLTSAQSFHNIGALSTAILKLSNSERLKRLFIENNGIQILVFALHRLPRRYNHVHQIRRSVESALQALGVQFENRVPPGISKRDFEALPKEEFDPELEKEEVEKKEETAKTRRPNNRDCPICLQDYSAGDNLCLLPACHHRFHTVCIQKWVVQNVKCPICRTVIVPSASSTSSSS